MQVVGGEDVHGAREAGAGAVETLTGVARLVASPAVVQEREVQMMGTGEVGVGARPAAAGAECQHAVEEGAVPHLHRTGQPRSTMAEKLGRAVVCSRRWWLCWAWLQRWGWWALWAGWW